MQAVAEETLFIPAGVDRLLRDLIHERSGVFYDTDRLSLLIERMEPLARARKCYSMLDFYYLLKNEDNGREDWSHVADALAVPETFFWREMAAVRHVVDVVAPAWLQHTTTPLTIWSAACSGGEEPYSIAIALEEAGLGGCGIQIYGTDASPAAIQKAYSGLYRENSFRSLPMSIKTKYFTPEGPGWRINASIANKVLFKTANLMEPLEISSLARSSVVFCRNVFIYFSPHAIRQTVATFAARMAPGSHLFVGAAESLLKLTSDFELREIEGGFAYVRL
jgi:chemotaxis protein methyltransferase CheR